MSFQGEIKAVVGWNWDAGALDSARLDYSKRLYPGSGDKRAEAVWHIEDQILLAGETVTFDLTALSRDVFGGSMTLTLLAIKALLIVNLSDDQAELVVGGAASDTWWEPFFSAGDQVVVPRGSPLLLSNRRDGWLTDTSNKNLKLAAVGGNVLYSMAIVGTTTVPVPSSSSGV